MKARLALQDRLLKRRAWLGFFSLGLLGLTGCATPRAPSNPSAAFWSGRMALQLDGTPPQNWSTSFELQGSATQGQLVLLSPLGTSLARLSWSPELAVLEQGQDKTESPNLQSLSQRLTGTQLPIAALFEWLAGRALDEPGWQVDLTAYPQGRLTASRITPAPQAILRIVLER
jgi:outer membrane lipoprotein LolB